MSVAAKDEEVREVVAELDGLLAQLRANVNALNAILDGPPPPADSPGQEVPVR